MKKPHNPIPRRPSPPWINIPLGLIQYGDLSNWTTYRTAKGRLVWFPKTWPKKPPSPLQNTWHAKMRASALSWRNLTREQRSAYHRACLKLSLPLPPFALKFALDNAKTPKLKSTIERQSGETLA